MAQPELSLRRGNNPFPKFPSWTLIASQALPGVPADPGGFWCILTTFLSFIYMTNNDFSTNHIEV